MTPEKLQRANAITTEVRELKAHLKDLYSSRTPDVQDPYENGRLIVVPSNTNYGKDLKTHSLPIVVPVFMKMYISLLEKRIETLEKEFEVL